MGHIVQTEPWGTVDLDTQRGHVLVRQDWRYHWTNDSNVPAWTPQERSAYHRAVDRLVWRYWSFHTFVEVRKTGANAGALAHFSGKGLTMSFDVHRVKVGGQWTVFVQKIRPDKRPRPRAEVWFQPRKIQLFSEDVKHVHAFRFMGDPARTAEPNFYVAPHEFGHALGYGYARGDGEERERENPYFADTTSIMNMGQEVRPRHIRLIIETLRKMVPGVEFVATGVMR